MKKLSEIYAEQNKDQNNRQTNKGDWEHGGYFRCHIDLYEEILAPYRQTATRVFEIGVNKGGSIRMWQEYFPNARIFGLDSSRGVVANLKAEKLERVTSLRVNQNDPDQLREFVDQHAFHEFEKFDVGIDDGSHTWEDQIKTFEILWPCIKDNGLYVIEDTLNSYVSGTGYAEPSAVDYFKEMVDKINFWGKDTVDSPDDLQSTIGWIGFRYNCIFIKKQRIKHT